MEVAPIDEAVMWLEKANADLEPELLSADAARDLLAAYAQAEKLASFGKTVLERKVDDATEVARVTGTSVGSSGRRGRAWLPPPRAVEHARDAQPRQHRRRGRGRAGRAPRPHPLPHFAIVGVVVAAVAVAASRLLLPSSVDAVNDSAGDGLAGAGNLSSWFRNWSAPTALLYVLPLAISAGDNVPGEAAATAAARVSTLAYLGSFAGPAVIGGLASLYSLPVALALPALLVGVTAFGARAVRPAERIGDARSSSAAAG